eukprot:scaffold191181_cov36-Prasinocladus_malaysianus.AAC.1
MVKLSKAPLHREVYSQLRGDIETLGSEKLDYHFKDKVSNRQVLGNALDRFTSHRRFAICAVVQSHHRINRGRRLLARP